MKCPYRKKTVNFVDNTTSEQFLNCYENECPLYCDGKCARAEMEREIFNKNYEMEDFAYERESYAG